MTKPTASKSDTLIALYEHAREDPAAYQELRCQFDTWTTAMREGREARRDLGMLAYHVSERQAERNLRASGRFGDLPNEPQSVAARHWERFQNFCDDVDKGVRKTLDDFMARVNSLTKYVLLDLVAEMHRRERDGESIEEGIADPKPGPGPDSETESDRRRDEYRDALQLARATLPCHLFMILTLHVICAKPLAEVAEILGVTPEDVRRDFREARRLLNLAAKGGDRPAV